MKLKMVALLLLLAILTGAFGCAARVDEPLEEAVIAEKPNFIGGKSVGLEGTNAVERPQNLINFAKTDEKGQALYQIVCKQSMSQALSDEILRFANDVHEVTGVLLQIVDPLSAKKSNEIILQVGNEIVRPEVLPITDEYGAKLGNHEFVIAAEEIGLIIYGKTDQAVISALMLLSEVYSYQNAESGEYGVSADTLLLYQPVEHPPVEVLNSTDPLYFEFRLENSDRMYTYVRLSFTGNNGWRLQTKFLESQEYNDNGAAQRLALSLGKTFEGETEKIDIEGPIDGIYTLKASDDSYVTLNTGKDSFRMDFYTASGKLASSVTNLSTSRAGSMITGLLEEDEALFGTGQRFDRSNQRGKYIDMFTKDIWSRSDACYMVIPLLCSSRGSGIFVNLFEPMTMDLGYATEDAWKTVTDGCALDVYFYTTEKIPEVIQAYSELTGYAEMPEEWTYGMIVCAYGPELSQKWTAQITPGEDGRNEGVYEMIANMEKYDLPWTGVLAEAWDTYTDRYHEDLKELCDYVHSLGKKFMVYIMLGMIGGNIKVNPNVSDRELNFLKNEYYLMQARPGGVTHMLPQTNENNNNPDSSSTTRAYVDITNPEAVDWYFTKYFDYLSNEVGVDGIKIDFCEQIPENYELLYYDESIPTAGSHHWYPSAFCSMLWGVISAKPDSGMLYTRGGGIGIQKAPYMWAGDQTRGFRSLRYQMTSVLSSGLSGVPYMSYDMSGYQYGDFSSDIAYESQVFLRGTQFTAYTICMQTHGKVRRSYQFAEQDENYAYVTEIYRAYTKLHEHLTPYITELCEEASTTGMPVMRHLILGWQDDKTVWNIEDQYTFGDAFMIAPILSEENVRSIYLPAGEWIDLNTGEEYSVGADGMWLESYEASIAELPTFYNKNTESEIAPTLVDGIMELYDYARGVAP